MGILNNFFDTKMSKLKYYTLQDEFAFNYVFHSRTYSVEDADIILFTGGADIDPSLYNKTLNKRVYSTEESRQRDAAEVDLYFSTLHKHKVGVCRGAQFLSVMSGASMFQHVDGHRVAHWMKTYTGENVLVTSTHHQMIDLRGVKEENYKLLGWSSLNLTKDYYEHGDTKATVPKSFKEPELIFFPRTKSLAMQFHPEFNTFSKDAELFLDDVVSDFVNNAL